METRGFVVPASQGRVWEMAAGRSSALKLLRAETGESVMMFEETAPSGTETTHHLHHDSDEVAYVLAGKITFKIGEEVGGPVRRGQVYPISDRCYRQHAQKSQHWRFASSGCSLSSTTSPDRRRALGSRHCRCRPWWSARCWAWNP